MKKDGKTQNSLSRRKKLVVFLYSYFSYLTKAFLSVSPVCYEKKGVFFLSMYFKIFLVFYALGCLGVGVGVGTEYSDVPQSINEVVV